MPNEATRLPGNSIQPVLPIVSPNTGQSQLRNSTPHPAIYIAIWIALSSSVIVFNKWILSTKEFKFPIFLTTWHLIFATIMTQYLARFTTILDSRKNVPMTRNIYLRAVVPIGLFFSLSLICNNQAYLYLSVAFIQMLKGTSPVTVLLATWALRMAPVDIRTLGNVSFIVIGVIIASIGEIKFEMVGFLFQCSGILFEAVRLVMVQRLLSSSEFKMDPLVSLYYYAPVCAIINGCVWIFIEMGRMSMDDISSIGNFILLANALVAFLLNVSVVFLISKTSSLVFTLSGVLKDIILVFASVLLFGDPVSLLQAFGYSIALAGLLYYKLGAEKIKDLLSQSGMVQAVSKVNAPVARKLLLFGVIMLVMFICFRRLGFGEQPSKIVGGSG